MNYIPMLFDKSQQPVVLILFIIFLTVLFLLARWQARRDHENDWDGKDPTKWN